MKKKTKTKQKTQQQQQQNKQTNKQTNKKTNNKSCAELQEPVYFGRTTNFMINYRIR